MRGQVSDPAVIENTISIVDRGTGIAIIFIGIEQSVPIRIFTVQQRGCDPFDHQQFVQSFQRAIFGFVRGRHGFIRFRFCSVWPLGVIGINPVQNRIRSFNGHARDV